MSCECCGFCVECRAIGTLTRPSDVRTLRLIPLSLPTSISRLVLTATVLICVAVPSAQQSDTTRNPLGTNPAAIAAGQQLYNRTCQACHGPAGVGERGPALNTGAFAHGREDGDLFHVIRDGVTGSQMPPFRELSDEQVWQLVSYVRSLTNPPPTSPAAAVAASGGIPANGERLFFGTAGCAGCHQVNGRGSIVGPDLSTAGRRPLPALRQKILDPNARETTGRGGRGRGAIPQVIVATTSDGRQIRGVRRNEDTFSVQMMDASGQLHLFDKLTLADFRVENRSLMPADYATRLTGGDLNDLLAYLGRLQERDLTVTSTISFPGGVTFDRLVKAAAEPHNWLMYWGNFQGTHYSGLSAIDTTNVRELRAAWTFPLPGESVLEATPLVIDGVMYTTQPGAVAALDARTGRQIWRYARPQKVRSPYEINPFNRGVAVLGQRLFLGTLDAALIALDARTGLPLWETPVADSMLGYSLTSAPLIVKDKVLVGITGGEFGARGFLDAYDAATGRRLWRWYSVPPPGEFGNDTWLGESWKQGGSPMWLTGSYDPELNLVFWTVGNPGPQIDRSARGDLDNLFSDSVVAIDPDTGQRKWHYQFTPNDGHDWDACQDVVLVDRMWRGQMRKLLLQADRNGIFYVIDRTNGKLLSGTPFVHANWNAGFDANGRPIAVPGSNSSREGSFFVYPTLGGATNFQAPSYSPQTGWLYLAYSENGQQYVSAPATFEAGRQYIGRAEGAAAAAGPRAGDPAASAGIKALDPETGKTMWDFKIFQGSLTNGVLATAGGVLFGAIRDGNLVALDARTGKHLWHFQTGANMAASPVSYAVDGRQFVAISAGNVVYAFALPPPRR
jgi:PQQ-dependent dehydrogenase (methanol/ethanol family)